MKTNKGIYLLKHFTRMKLLLLSMINHFVLDILLHLTCVARIFIICLPIFQNHHLSLDALLNKVFEPK